MVALSLSDVRERLEELVDRLARGEAVEIARASGPVLRVVAEASPSEPPPRKPFDIAEMRRIAALSKPYIDPEGLSFVERLRRDDLL